MVFKYAAERQDAFASCGISPGGSAHKLHPGIPSNEHVICENQGDAADE